MTGFWMFIATLAIGAIWLTIAAHAFRAAGYVADHAGGWLIGLTPEEVNNARKWRENNE